MLYRRLFARVLPLLTLAGCATGENDRPLFMLLPPERTGVAFSNTITTNDSVNIQSYYFIYNGGGVAAGDIDNDGLSDLYFTGNMVSSRLYLNKGGMRFEDITDKAGVGTRIWASGASMVDINSDGFLDIYVSVSGTEWSTAKDRANLLFLNNGNRTFTEAASQFGLADTGFTTHTAFLDYDRDGDLDAYLLGNSPEDFARGEAELHPAGVRSKSTRSYDELYRNNGDGTFTNVSRSAGLLRQVGYGLGVAVADINRDGWPDIYVSNDDTPNDVLYVNNGDGTFTDKAAAWIKHASFAGMGVDVADFNNDGWDDILQSDMMPEHLPGRKRMSGAVTYGTLTDFRRRGFRDDYQINTLQLSSGVTPGGDIIFSDIARLAGVAYTDWSWTSLFGDYDNDGYKDILITNGYPKAANDYDYQMAMLGVKRRRGDPKAAQTRGREFLAKLHGYHVPNYVFRNAGDLTFADKTKAWGMDQPSFSYGAAHADLNNDGTLDLVVNNIDGPAFIYENARQDTAHHYLRIELRGEPPNRGGIGSQLILTAGGQKQYVYHSPYRGYISSMEPRAHFGLGRASRVDTLEVVWPDGRYQRLTDVAVDRVLVLKQTDANADGKTDVLTDGKTNARATLHPSSRASSRPWMRPSLRPPFGPLSAGLTYKHQADARMDFAVQPLLPHFVSRQGPAVASGDVTGDGLEDVFVGGGPGQAGQLFIQQKGGDFVASTHAQPWETDKAQDDWGALFFDANGDGRLDLYVASGGYHLAPSSSLLQDRLYINEGGGRFVRDARALPAMLTSSATVRAGDFTGDGRLDLFVGGRLTPLKYPYPTRSYLLRNDGGRFTDVTQEIAPELVQPGGMITDALWIDYDRDGRLDLITAGEWMPLQFYRNDGKRLRDVTQATRLPPLRGWWYSLAAGDFNHDGHPDLVAGNLGLNYSYTTSRESRFGVYAADFTGNNTTDIVLTKEIDGKEYPFFGMAMLGRHMYPVRLKFPSYASFAVATVPQIFTDAQLRRSLHYQTDTFASVYLQNNGDGTFTSSALPNLAQIAPIKGIVVHDVDADGHLDLIVAGNLYDTEPNTPRADAGNGLWLRGDGRGHFIPVPARESGFLAPLNVTGLALIKTPAGNALLVANNGDSLRVFSIRKEEGGRRKEK